VGSTAEVARLAARAYARYLVPLTLLSVLALAPWLWLAAQLRPPADVAGARGALRLAWIVGGTAWIGQLLLVGGAAPLVRALDAGAPLSQLGALGRGALQLARAAVPWLAAVAAIAVGGLALAVPGLVLLCLFALVPASARPGLPGPLVESAAAVRSCTLLVGGAIAALLALDLALVYAAQVSTLPPPAKKLSPDQLALYRRHVQIVAAGAAVIAPWIATLLAAVHARAARARAPGPRP
jgi:hypothetical protein